MLMPEECPVLMPEEWPVLIPEGRNVLMLEGEPVLIPEGGTVLMPEGGPVLMPKGKNLLMSEGGTVLIPEEASTLTGLMLSIGKYNGKSAAISASERISTPAISLWSNTGKLGSDKSSLTSSSKVLLSVVLRRFWGLCILGNSSFSGISSR